jgi:hypothetical protein
MLCVGIFIKRCVSNGIYPVGQYVRVGSFRFLKLCFLTLNPLTVRWRKENVRELCYQCGFDVAAFLRSFYSFHISHGLPLEPRKKENLT